MQMSFVLSVLESFEAGGGGMAHDPERKFFFRDKAGELGEFSQFVSSL